MNWRKWKTGAGVALLCGVLTAIAGISDDMHGWAIARVFGTAVGTSFLCYVKSHPVEEVQDGDPKP